MPGRDDGLTIPVGMRVSLNFGGAQRDEDYFPDAEAFDPDRFAPENRRSIVPGTFQPWGSGPRMCIGVQGSDTEGAEQPLHCFIGLILGVPLLLISS